MATSLRSAEELRIKGIPVTFLVVVMVTVLLTIFFGAWAVSADVDQNDRDLSFALAIGSPNVTTLNAGSSAGSSPGDASTEEEEDTAGEKWWGQAVLKACPFH